MGWQVPFAQNCPAAQARPQEPQCCDEFDKSAQAEPPQQRPFAKGPQYCPVFADEQSEAKQPFCTQVVPLGQLTEQLGKVPLGVRHCPLVHVVPGAQPRPHTPQF